MEMIIFKEGSNSYNLMWDWIKNHPINAGIENPEIAYNDGDTWQHMGSFRQGDRTISEFRHRKHPSTDDRVNLKFSHPNIVPEEDIEVKYAVK